jgi:hypothetical protein
MENIKISKQATDTSTDLKNSTVLIIRATSGILDGRLEQATRIQYSELTVDKNNEIGTLQALRLDDYNKHQATAATTTTLSIQ